MSLLNQWDIWCIRGLKGICDLLKERTLKDPFMESERLSSLKEEIDKLDVIYYETTGVVETSKKLSNERNLTLVDNCIIGGYVGLNNLMHKRIAQYKEPIEIEKMKRRMVLDDLAVMGKLIKEHSV